HARLQARAQAQAASLRLRLHRRLGRWRTIARDVVSPSAWPLAWKMTLAMIGTALLPMLITAYYNLRVNVQAASTAELTGLAQLARSTAGRVAQLLG
ncbi:hypothetical protein NYY77_18945, partial [Acinetobacter baumannii]|nr:hypothetical protein [Acinetobacter baumannii]